MNTVVRTALYLSVITLCIYYSAQAEKILPRATCCAAVSKCFQDKDAGKCGIRCSTGCYPCGTTTFIPRSQGANTARELVGWQRQLFRPFLIESYVTVGITSEYTRSFRPERIARTLFCTDCLSFAGSAVNKNNGSEVVADNFGLSTRFRGTLAIKPRIENYLVDINLFFGLNEWWPGLYWRIHAPIVHTRWQLGLNECKPCADRSRGDTEFPFCYMSSNPINSNETAHNLREALSGKFLFGDMQTRWCFGRFSFCPLSKAGLADLDLIMGYNVIENDCKHVGLYAQLVVPTGNRPKARYIFEPIRGNGHHWEFGVGLSAHALLFDDGYFNGHSFGLYFEGNVTNIFKNEQLRSFDFTRNGLLSRYLLLKEFDINNNYTGRLINAINFATRTAIVRVGYKTDFSIKLAYQFGPHFMADIGYNLYARSAETVCIKTDCPCDIDQRRFGFKGTQPVCMGASAAVILDNTVDPAATLFTTSARCTAQQQASTDGTENYKSTTETTETQTEKDQVILPTFISCKDLDPTSAAQCSMLTHKFFAHIGYTWHDYCYQPHVGIGGEVEVDGRHTHNSLNQWGIWIKGGVTF